MIVNSELRGQNLSRRAILRMFGLSAGAVALAACGPANQPTASAPTAVPAASKPGPTPVLATTVAAAKPTAPIAADQPRSGGTLRVGILTEPPNMDGFIQLSVIRNQLWLFFDKLIDMDQKGMAQPRLASSWDMGSDFNQLKLNLRQGVNFHTGREMTSEDVKWNLERTHDPKAGNGNLPPLFANLKDVEAPDKNTVLLNFVQPWPAVFDILNFVNIVDPQSQPKDTPVGTGPFTFGEWKSGDSLRLLKNKNYWQSGKPYLDEIVFHFIKDAQAMVVQLESGAIDVADPAPTTDAARLQKLPDYQVVVSSNPAAINILGVNVATPPLDKKQVRQALNFALDRQRMVDSALGGFGEPRILPWPSTSIAYDPATANTYAFNLDKAKALLSAAGVADFEVELTYPTSTPEYQTMGQIYQADLRKLNITLTLKALDPAAWNNYVIQTKTWGLSFATTPPVNLHPSSVLARVWTSPASNINNFRSDAWTDLAGRVAATGDPAKLKALSAELNQFLLDESWYIPLSSAPPKLAARTSIRGIVFDANDTPTYYDAWLST
jgi:peptide/nickel transport system substrate-binding protein